MIKPSEVITLTLMIKPKEVLTLTMMIKPGKILILIKLVIKFEIYLQQRNRLALFMFYTYI